MTTQQQDNVFFIRIQDVIEMSVPIKKESLDIIDCALDLARKNIVENKIADEKKFQEDLQMFIAQMTQQQGKAAGKEPMHLISKADTNKIFEAYKLLAHISTSPAPTTQKCDYWKCIDHSDGNEWCCMRPAGEGEAGQVLIELESGLKTYEEENRHKQVVDECLGIYIPINVVRRLIDVRREKYGIRRQQQQEGDQ